MTWSQNHGVPLKNGSGLKPKVVANFAEAGHLQIIRTAKYLKGLKPITLLLFLKTNIPFADCFGIAFFPFIPFGFLVFFWCFSETSFNREDFQLPAKNKIKRGNF